MRRKRSFKPPTSTLSRSAGRRRRKARRTTNLGLEPLEDRLVLAAIVTLSPAQATAAGLLDDLLGALPADTQTALRPVRNILDFADSSATYVGFPGEVNEVDVTGDLANTFLLVNEDSNVSLLRSGLVFTRDLLDVLVPSFSFDANAGGSVGPLIAFVDGLLGFGIELTSDQIKAGITQIFDLTDARAIVANPSALLDVIPELGNFVGVIDSVLDFDLRQLVPEISIEPIIDIGLPFGLPDIEIPPELNVDIVEYLELDELGVPLTLGELADAFPGPVEEAFQILTGFVDFFTQDFISDKLSIATLDGPDTINVEKITGLDILALAGPGDDTIRLGGGTAFLDELNSEFGLPFDLFTAKSPAELRLFGEAGRDTFVIGPRFDSLDTEIDGGDDSDLLLIEGSDHGETIRIVAHPDGRLNEIQFLDPDPNGNVPTEEVQTITLPANTDGGTFTLRFTDPSGVTGVTAPIVFDAAATGPGSVQARLEDLTNIGTGDVAVSGTPGGPWTVRFTQALANQNISLLQADGSALSQDSADVDVARTVQGDPLRGVNEIQRITLPTLLPSGTRYVSGGTLTLEFGGDTTAAIPHSATRTDIRNALEALPSIQSLNGGINVTGSAGGPWSVEFQDLQSHSLITANGALLTGGISGDVTVFNEGVPLNAVVRLPSPLAGQVLGGDFRLFLDGVPTGPLSFNASASQVQDALENLPNANEVSVTGPFGGPWNVTLSGSGAAGGLTGDAAGLTGGVDLDVQTTTPASGSNEVQQLRFCMTSNGTPCDGQVTGGTFTMDVESMVGGFLIRRTTEPIPFDATAAEFQQALEDLATVGPGNVEVTKASVTEGGETFTQWTIRYQGDLAGTDLGFGPTFVDLAGLVTTGGATVATFDQVNGVAGDDEVQTITPSATLTSGDFTLTFDGRTTDPLPFNATPNEVRDALEDLNNIGDGSVSVTGSAGGPWLVAFDGGIFAQADVPLLSANPQNLTGGFGVGSISIERPLMPLLPPLPAENEIQTVSFSDPETGLPLLPAGGTFRLRFDGETTIPLVPSATALDVQTALQALPTIGAGSVSVSGGVGNWTVTFTGTLAARDVSLLSVDAAGLRRNEPILVELTQEASLANETQVVSIPASVTGGDFTLTFQSIVVSETVRGDGSNNERQVIGLPSGVTGGTFQLEFGGLSTPPLASGAAAATIQAALEQLASIGIGNVLVGPDPAAPADPTRWQVTFQGALANTDVALLRADSSQLTGPFTTGPIPFDGMASAVQSALEALPSIGVGNVSVSGDAGGPWTVEFIGALEGTPLQLMVGDGSNLAALGGSDPTVTTTTPGGDGNDVLISTKRFPDNEFGEPGFRNVEKIVVDGGGGGDRLEIIGAVDVPQGIFFSGGDGIDLLRATSKAAAPVFVAPPFPNDDGAVFTMDGLSIEFDSMEGGLSFVGGESGSVQGDVTLAGTDTGDEMRFIGLSANNGLFVRDTQVSIFLENFAADSKLTLQGQQGDDTIELALNGVTDFSPIVIEGGGPGGGNGVRLEGTSGPDTFVHTPDAASVDAGVIMVESVEVQYVDINDVIFVGRGGVDSLHVNEPAADSNDLIRFFPETANNGTLLLTSQSGGPETALVHAPVSFTSIETRNLNTGTGTDTVFVSTDNFPGVRSGLSIDGGSGVAELLLGDQKTLITHDPSAEDHLIFDITATRDEHQIDVTPGLGLAISLSVGAGQDILAFHAKDANVTVDLEVATISQPGFGDVTFVGTEDVRLLGGGTASPLTFLGPGSRERITYAPIDGTSGAVFADGAWAGYGFEGFAGTLTINGGAAGGDELVVEGSSDVDAVRLDGTARTVSIADAAGSPLKSVTIGTGVEIVTLNGLAGDDAFSVSPASTPPLTVRIDGGTPNASDRLVVEDEGPGDLVLHREAPDRRSGSITIGAMAPIDYDHVERVDILPLDPITGRTGADAMGKLVVFDTDPFEQNDALPLRTDFPALFEVAVNPNIDPGASNAPFTVPGDEDWYRFDALSTGTLRFDLLFEAVPQLPNGNPGLPADGLLMIEVYDPSGTVTPKLMGEGDASHTIGVEGGQSYSLRVRGVTPEAINNYDIRVSNLDEAGPRVTDVLVTVDPSYDLFSPKPTEGPTPLVNSITIRLEDVPERFPGFLYEALNQGIAEAVGHYQVIGDHNGIIPIASVEVINDPVVEGNFATASITLNFDPPLPDDRFTLIVSEDLVDPVGNRLDGESNASEPQEDPTLPSGDGVAGGDFVARFTVDSRAELGVWAAGSVYVDTNGNFTADPENKDNDDTNEDITYVLGFTSDNVFAGNFAENAAAPADGFDKLAAYGRVAGAFRWLVDTDNNGVPNLVVADPFATNGLPVAGDFDGNATNGDEVGLKDGVNWHLDTGHVFNASTTISGDMQGYPIVGDFDGDGVDDLGSWTDDTFSLDLSTQLTGAAAAGSYNANINGITDVQFTFGFPGVRERPIAGDFDGDGIDDLGLWTPDRDGAVPSETSEWYVLISDGTPIPDRIVANPQALGGNIVDFTPEPFGKDIYGQFGNDFTLPVVGNFDPPVVDGAAPELRFASFTNPSDPVDVNDDGVATPADALRIINVLNRGEGGVVTPFRSEAHAAGPFFDTNGDDAITPLDVLKVINWLNDAAGGEGEAAPVADGLVSGVDLSFTTLVYGSQPAVEATDAVSPAARPIPAGTDQPVDAFFARPEVPAFREAERDFSGKQQQLEELLDALAGDLGDQWWRES